MKYKKQIATGALALSLLVGGSSVFARTPEDLGIKNVQRIYQRQNKEKDRNKNNKEFKKQHDTVGIISALTNSGFTINVTNRKIEMTSSVDVKTDTTTVYKKDGLNATTADLLVGQKVIVIGNLDKSVNVLTAKTVKIVTKIIISKIKKEKEVKIETKAN